MNNEINKERKSYSYTYDKENRLKTVRSQDNQLWTYDYDRRNNRLVSQQEKTEK